MTASVSKQVAYAVTYSTGMTVAKQVAYVVIRLSGMNVTKQVAYMPIYAVPISSWRRQVMLGSI